jgi:hypothetical protein
MTKTRPYICILINLLFCLMKMCEIMLRRESVAAGRLRNTGLKDFFITPFTTMPGYPGLAQIKVCSLPRILQSLT